MLFLCGYPKSNFQVEALTQDFGIYARREAPLGEQKFRKTRQTERGGRRRILIRRALRVDGLTQYFGIYARREAPLDEQKFRKTRQSKREARRRIFIRRGENAEKRINMHS